MPSGASTPVILAVGRYRAFGRRHSIRGVSVLSREELRLALAAVPPLVEGVDETLQLQPNGIDIRVESVRQLMSRAVLGIDAHEPAARADVACDAEGWWDLEAGAYVIGYRERVNLPNE